MQMAKEGKTMDKIGAYSAYQKTYADSLANRKDMKSAKKEEVSVVKKTEKSGAEKVELSSKAKELLNSANSHFLGVVLNNKKMKMNKITQY